MGAGASVPAGETPSTAVPEAAVAELRAAFPDAEAGLTEEQQATLVGLYDPEAEEPLAAAKAWLAANVAASEDQAEEQEQEDSISVPPDPWAGKTADECWRLVKLNGVEMELPGVEIDADAVEVSGLGLVECLDAALGEHAEAVVASAADCDGEGEFVFGAALQSRVVVLDLGGNMFETFNVAPDARPTWLRSLTLSSSSLASPVELPAMPLLLSLDLSFVPLGDVLEGGLAAFTWSAVPGLRRLNLEGCELETLAGLSGCSSLVELNLSDNALPDCDALQPLAGLAMLEVLDLRQNACASGPVYRGGAWRAGMSRLRMLDNMSLASGNMSAALSTVDGVAEAVGRTDTVADQMENREGCSCLEGNPCTDKYMCKDWEHREEIAKKVRQEKRLELEYP